MKKAIIVKGTIIYNNFLSKMVFTTSSPLKALEDYFLPSETWFTKGRCLILVVKHPTKLFTVLSID